MRQNRDCELPGRELAVSTYNLVSCLKGSGMRGIGIVGAGLIGTWHAARWKQLQNNRDGRLELVGFYDVSPAAAAKSATEFGGHAFKKLDDLL